MTAVDDRPPTGERRHRRAPQGGRPPGHRPDHLDRQPRSCPGCCTWRSCAARWPTPASPPSTSRPPRHAANVVAVFTGADLRRRVRRPALRLAGHRGHGHPAHPPLASTRSATSATPSPSSWPGTGPGRRRRRAVVVDYDPLPAVVDLEAGARRRGRRSTTDSGTNKLLLLARCPRADIDEAFDGADHVVKRRFIQQRLHARRDRAPGGAVASRRRLRRVHGLLGHPGPAHPAH
jgi:CO/xanthine dehydrogenase Mo-binding subunit